MAMAKRIQQLRITRMAHPICIRYKDTSQTPYKRLAILMDATDWVENGGRLTENTIKLSNSSDWRAFSFAGYSLILIW